eukprot:249859_1
MIPKVKLFILSTIYCLTFATNAATETLKEYNWIVTREYKTPDCVEKLVLTINGEFPGPEIRVYPNEEILIHVYNKLPTESITIHWHGQHQINTPWMDGISKISQCPIAPYSTFTYRFKANEEAGTYFYHIHSGALIEGGAYGAFIIINNDHNYDGEFTMLVSDNYHRETYHSLFNLLGAAGQFRWVFDPNSIIINGKGRYDCYDNDDYTCDSTNQTDPYLCSQNDAYVCGAHQRDYTRFSGYGSGGCDNNGNNCAYEEFKVEKGKTYLFRLINPSPLSHLNVKFEKHIMTVVAVDSYAVEPINLDSIDIHSGQRVDVEVEMIGDIDSSYWITGKIRSRGGVRYGPAILRYDNNDNGQPSDVEYMNLGQPVWDNYTYTRNQQNNYIGLSNPPSMDEVTKRFMLLSTQERYDMDNDIGYNGESTADITDMQSIIGNNGYRPEDNCDSNNNVYKLRWAINRATFKMPNTPSLLHNVFRTNEFETLAATNPLSYIKIEKDKIYDVIFQNYPACNGVCETHSIHLHGHSFWVLGHFEGEWTGSQTQINALCTQNCPKRDTAFLIADDTRPELSGCGYTVVRFIANSPGVWPIHCHQSWHFLMGKVALFYYDSSEIQLTPNISDIGICGDLNALDVVNTYMPKNIINTTEEADFALNYRSELNTVVYLIMIGMTFLYY